MQPAQRFCAYLTQSYSSPPARRDGEAAAEHAAAVVSVSAALSGGIRGYADTCARKAVNASRSVTRAATSAHQFSKGGVNG
jgi:hypothetical protein